MRQSSGHWEIWGEQAVLTAAQEFRTWMVQFEDIEATIDNTRNGVIMSLMNVYRGIYERFSTPYEDQQIEQIRMSILRDARVFAPASDDDAHNMLCGAGFSLLAYSFPGPKTPMTS